MRELPDVVPNAPCPGAARLVRRIAEAYRIKSDVPTAIRRRAKIPDSSQPGRWASGERGIGAANARRLRGAFPLLAEEINDAARLDHAMQLERESDGEILARPTKAAPPSALADLWLRLDDDQRAAVVQLAEAIASAKPGKWLAGSVKIFEMQAAEHPLEVARQG